MFQIDFGEIQIDQSWLEINPWLVVLVAIAIVAFLAVTVIWGMRAHRRQISAGKEELVGRRAEVKVTLDPKGIVFIEGEQWAAVSEHGRIEAGEEVIITKVDSLKLYVTRKE